MDSQYIKNQNLSSPTFIINTEVLLNNLKQLNILRQATDCKILYSIKALPLSTVLENVMPWVDGFSVSSLFEAQLAHEILKGQGSLHLTSPGIRTDEWHQLAPLLTHISFNSFSQQQQITTLPQSHTASIGLRINPKLSFLNDNRFDPCQRHSKLGVDIDELWQNDAIDSVNGLHIHTVFSATDFMPLVKTIEKLRHYFGHRLAQLKWINLGGGYLFNQIKDYEPFIKIVTQLKHDYNLEVYIEPGKAIVNNAGYFLTTVIDCFISDGKHIAILDTTVNHHPEIFEYQRQPDLLDHVPKGKYSIILAGSSCLAGDILGEYQFNQPLKIGDKLIFKDVGAYSLIKANRFNGYNLPSIYSVQDQQIATLKHYQYQDFRQQWYAD